MICAQRVLNCDEIKSLCYDTDRPYSLGKPNFIRLELSVTDDDNLFEDVNMRYDQQ